MNIHQLQSQIKSTRTAYVLFFFLFGTNYACLGKWEIQFLYWFTLGGFGIWVLIDLFTIPGMVKRHNAIIFEQIEKENTIKQDN